LISRRFEASPGPFYTFFLSQRSKYNARFMAERFHWRTFLERLVYRQGGSSSGSKRRAIMAWKAPKIVEVPVGMEINMYACAARK
jgi:coenzyme PQQ precursor peptide PqqA